MHPHLLLIPILVGDKHELTPFPNHQISIYSPPSPSFFLMWKAGGESPGVGGSGLAGEENLLLTIEKKASGAKMGGIYILVQ